MAAGPPTDPQVTTEILVSVVLGTCLAGFVQGLSGFAFGLVAMSVWSWSIAPQLAAPMVVFGSVIGQLLAVGVLRRGFNFGRAMPFIVGGVFGVPLGTLLLHYVDPRLFRGGVGIFLILYCSVMLLARHLPVVTVGGRLLDGVAGWIGGVMGGLGGLTGPAPTLWCTLRGWDRDSQRAVFQSFNLVMQILTLMTYAVSGTLTRAMIPIFVVMVPASIVPTLAGVRLYRRISTGGFQRMVLSLLLVSGVLLVASLRH
jgi:uncharacterized membrane protein YfcA